MSRVILDGSAGTTESEPWWGVPLIAGSFLLIGAVIALVSTALSDGRKMRREDRRQWDQQVRDAYNRVRELCRQISDAVQGVASARWETEFSRRKDILDEGFLAVGQARLELYSIRRDFDIIADRGVADATDRVIEIVEEICEGLLQSQVPGELQQDDLQHAEGHLALAVRKNFRLPTPSVSGTAWWRSVPVLLITAASLVCLAAVGWIVLR